jgi:hypothetical protein
MVEVKINVKNRNIYNKNKVLVLKDFRLVMDSQPISFSQL